ncbi:bifunctional adenosylcobinamide kinase/adenosylcobinamide-phosphate guanylyltransferase [Massilia sp. NEAU-DD11]|jgi:adenosylcobinamide kinase/adenosylcobinamide-phosphate guanylyltransferase|uniref:Bifunctional adenosylcobalamin biosynthesis protein n=1 Tax=Massilia cellulosiltytica TaxID=2683234 RepID=A0A7X3G6G7_9BURK|nr:bifunctional adenosylcobinamide kinase/adenosylcobinamide-phosphate guanylyltransferase [Telluria cellulosilytica]MVW64509.1 bifunctional adenosylcobinamide kinase/adenosylcobinamide-phosphate guanylyltransferase [Telluria cellulosilytica]
MSRTLVLGGARSGKSGLAERLARASGKDVVYVATSYAGDAEMAARIAHHRARRPAGWTTVEEATALAATLRTLCAPGRIVLVDCLTLWLTNLMFSTQREFPEVGPIDLPPLFFDERAALLDWLDAKPAGDVVFVSNETGMGIVPYGAVSRAFVDEAGRLNQDVAARCDRVLFVAAGLPLVLKGAPC